jgi:hypothetical protein
MRQPNRLLIAVSLLAVGIAVGCKKSNEPPSGAAAATEQAAGAESAPPSPRGPGPMPPAPTPAVIEAQANLTATLDQLSAELRKYVVRTRSVPKDFEDFLAKSQIQAPAPPAGKKYAIRNQAVVVVNR